MTLPKWIEEVKEELEKAEKAAAMKAYAAGLGASEYEAFLTPEAKVAPALLATIEKYREAMEFDPTQFPEAEERAVQLSIKYGIDAVQILEMANDLCKVFRQEALNFIPEGVDQ